MLHANDTFIKIFPPCVLCVPSFMSKDNILGIRIKNSVNSEALLILFLSPKLEDLPFSAAYIVVATTLLIPRHY